MFRQISRLCRLSWLCLDALLSLLTSEAGPLSAPGQEKVTNSWQRLWTTKQQTAGMWKEREYLSWIGWINANSVALVITQYRNHLHSCWLLLDCWRQCSVFWVGFFFAVTIFIFNASCMVGSLITTLITSAQETSHRGNSKWQQERNLLIQRKEKNHGWVAENESRWKSLA